MSNNPELDRDIETIKRTADAQARKGTPLTEATPPLGAAEGDCLCPDMGTVHPDCPAHGTSRFRGNCPYQDGAPCNCRHSDPCPVYGQKYAEALPREITDPVGTAAGLAPGWGDGRHSYHAVIEDGDENETSPGDVLGPSSAAAEVEALLDRAAIINDPAPRTTGDFAAQIAQEAIDLFTGARNATYGDATDNFTDIGDLWAVVFGHPVSAEQVAICSALIKVARLKHSPDHDDSWTDGSAYLALGGGIARRRRA